MPGKLVIEDGNDRAIAILGDQQLEKIDRLRAEGKDFTIQCYKPNDVESAKFFGPHTYIGRVLEVPDEPTE